MTQEHWYSDTTYTDLYCSGNVWVPKLPGFASGKDLNEPSSRHSLRAHLTHESCYALQYVQQLGTLGDSPHIVREIGLQHWEPEDRQCHINTSRTLVKRDVHVELCYDSGR